MGAGGEKEGESLNITYVANRRTLLECGDCYQRLGVDLDKLFKMLKKKFEWFEFFNMFDNKILCSF